MASGLSHPARFSRMLGLVMSQCRTEIKMEWSWFTAHCNASRFVTPALFARLWDCVGSQDEPSTWPSAWMVPSSQGFRSETGYLTDVAKARVWLSGLPDRRGDGHRTPSWDGQGTRSASAATLCQPLPTALQKLCERTGRGCTGRGVGSGRSVGRLASVIIAVLWLALT